MRNSFFIFFLSALVGIYSFFVFESANAQQVDVYNGPDKQIIEEALKAKQQKLLKRKRSMNKEYTDPRLTRSKSLKKQNSNMKKGAMSADSVDGYRIHPANSKRKYRKHKKPGMSKWQKVGLWTGAIAAGGVAAWAVGSGGGGSDGGSGDDGNNGIAGEDPLRFNLENINAQAAYDAGFTGKDILVGVIDSGVDGEHSELFNKVVAESFDLVLNRSGSKPLDRGGFLSHGTQAAGIIAGNKDGNGMHGVAYDAEILGLRAGVSDGTVFFDRSAEGIEYAVDVGAQVINHSYGSVENIGGVTTAAQAENVVGNALVDAAIYADENNVINVWSTGNSATDEVSVNAGLPVYFPQLRDTWLAVASVDAGNEISNFSNRCGIAADWCLVAPGENILAPGTDNSTDTGYSTVSGTSFSAPHVSGAVAVLMEAFPSLTPQQVVELLLDTATDLGELGVDEVYGHGIVNLEEAVRPQGLTSFATSPTVAGQNVTTAETVVRTGGAFGDAVISSQLATAIIDKYERTYLVDIADISTRKQFIENAHEILSGFAEKKEQRSIHVNDNFEFAITGENLNQLENSQGKIESASLVSHYDDLTIAAHHNVPMDDAFKFDATQELDSKKTMGVGTLNNPYLSFVGDGSSLVSSYRMNEFHHMKFSTFSGSAKDTSYQRNKEKTFGFVGEYSQKYQNNSIASLQFGVITEEETLLGSRFDGAFALADDSRTFFGSVAGKYPLSNNASLYMTGNIGMTYANIEGGNSLIRSVDTLYSDAFSVGAVIGDALSEDDVFGVSLSQPLRVRSGQAGMLLSTGRNLDGTLNYTYSNMSLTPSGREIDLEAFYSLPLGMETMLHTGAMLRMQPNHVKEADNDNVVLMRLNHNF